MQEITVMAVCIVNKFAFKLVVKHGIETCNDFATRLQQHFNAVYLDSLVAQANLCANTNITTNVRQYLL